ncbi:uncharacterized protein SPSC_06084 [Sporisorium scitamineum]|uniref:Uncharacterized protein n=1 Tax=Sporisorium scitamineum TaxID=49012 RepID=A0A127ZK98_9BASI|nr:uncharacterized protein SPSC_06084 [Sporisorium scitamineum]
MTTVHRRILTLALAFASLVPVFLAMPAIATGKTTSITDTGWHMLVAQTTVASHHQDRNLDWKSFGYRPAAEFNPGDRNGFYALALQMAEHDGAHYVGDEGMALSSSAKDLIRNLSFGREKKKKKKHHYFYTVVGRDTELGRKIGLKSEVDGGMNKVAMLLWKHKPGQSQPKVVGVDLIRDVDFLLWHGTDYFEAFSDVLAKGAKV